MGVHLEYADDGEIVVTPDSYKKDGSLTTYISNLIRADIKYQEARGRGGDSGGDRLEKAATLTRPDGTVSVLSKSAAVAALQESMETWESRAREYGLDPNLKQYLLSKSREARDEIDRLEGREPVAKAAKPRAFMLPR